MDHGLFTCIPARLRASINVVEHGLGEVMLLARLLISLL